MQGVVSGLTQIVPAAVFGGPLAGAAVGGTSIGMSRAEDLKRQGVDVGTRTAVGAVEGALAGAGAVLPAGGSTLARTAGLVAVGGPGMAVGQAAAEKAILRNAGWGHLSDQSDPLDPTNLAAATMVAGFLGGVHAVGVARANRAVGATPSAATPAQDVPLTSMDVAARKALPYNAPALDAYAVQVAQREGVPPALMLALKNAGEKSNSNQVSPKGARGVSQMMPGNLRKYGVADPTDPVQALDGMARYLAETMKYYKGDIQAVIADYNGGPRAAAALKGDGTMPRESAAYLDRVNAYMADRAIDDFTFKPTPQEVDAALIARGQRIVDDAYVFGRPDDINGMAAHQDMFELAARQMDNGQFPDVAHFVTPDDAARATALDSLIADTEAQRSQIVQQAADLAEPSTVTQMRAELDQLVAARPDDSPGGVKDLTRQLQGQGMRYKSAAAEAQKRIDALVADHDLQVRRLRAAIERNTRAQQAHQQLGALDSQLADLRASRATIDVPATRRTPLSQFIEGVVRAQAARPDVSPLASADPHPAGEPRTGIFGPIHDNFRGDAKGAIERLMADQTGEATAALHHPDVGDIDLVYGKAPQGRSEGFGLAKIAAKHPEVMGDLQGFLSRLHKDEAKSGPNRVRLVDDTGHAVVSLDWKGNPKTWLLTAYEGRNAGRDATMDTASLKPSDDTASLGTGKNIVGPGGTKGNGGPVAAAIDANLREAALNDTHSQITIDTPAGERTGTIAELLQQIDEEHAMNWQDAQLFDVAANCFISLGG
ncbi:lytic transglycosylase domain-containing protein [Burkholderia sp. TSV86]|uniref:lytic transglycosylase domain-containing protein n=1 Tax=Burkholderia sp. TSV86 TaxID=1385594 RepID=UPI001E613FEF|nr:lytic transglycosylase domain-containing protein [Burkholderia sp. TSV86]